MPYVNGVYPILGRQGSVSRLGTDCDGQHLDRLTSKYCVADVYGWEPDADNKLLLRIFAASLGHDLEFNFDLIVDMQECKPENAWNAICAQLDATVANYAISQQEQFHENGISINH